MILHLSDLHANDRWFTWLKRVADRYDLICVSGDLLDSNIHRPLGDQVERVIGHLRDLKGVPLALCSGNHDSLAGKGPRLHQAAWMQELRGAKLWIDGDEFRHQSYLFRCIGWSSPLRAAGPNEIWLVHAPPDRTKTSIVRGGVDFGSFEVGEICRSGAGPELILCGHVHDRQHFAAREMRTRTLNPGYSQHSPRPNFNVIDPARGIATHHGASGETDIIRLWPSHLGI